MKEEKIKNPKTKEVVIRDVKLILSKKEFFTDREKKLFMKQFD